MKDDIKKQLDNIRDKMNKIDEDLDISMGYTYLKELDATISTLKNKLDTTKSIASDIDDMDKDYLRCKVKELTTVFELTLSIIDMLRIYISNRDEYIAILKKINGVLDDTVKIDNDTIKMLVKTIKHMNPEFEDYNLITVEDNEE